PGAMADETAVQRPPRGREHHAQARRTVDDQADVDGIIVAAANELPGAVERVDQEIDVVVGRDASGGHLFLGDHRNARRGAGERGENDQLGRAVGLRHRRAVNLALNLETPRDNLEDRLTGLARGDGDLVEKLQLVQGYL